MNDFSPALFVAIVDHEMYRKYMMRHALRSSIKIALVIISFTILPNDVLAIVNIETLRQKSETGFSGETALNVNYSSGNTDELIFKTSTGSRNQSQSLTLLLVLTAELEERDDKRFDRRAFAHLRGHFWRQKLISPEAFVQTQYDETRRIDSRTLFGAGARMRLHSGESSNAFLGAGLMYEHEKERLTNGAHFITDIARISSYLSVFQKLGAIRFSSVSYLQPNVDRTSDYRAINETSFGVPLGGSVDIYLDFTLGYDSSPPENVEKTDTSTSFGLKIRW